MKAFINADIYTANEVITDRALLVDHGKITGFVAPSDLYGSVELVDLGGASMVPGYVDLQVNGGGGVLFNEAPTLDGLESIAAAHRSLGTTSILPTFITGEQAAMESAMSAVREALVRGMPGILGIHLEGPTLNQERAGVHNKSLIRRVDPDWLVRALADIPSLVTLAPETVDVAYIKTLTRAGIKVAVGHSNATGEQADHAVDAGASLVTHLYNACSQLTGREPGVVGVGLARREMFVSCIADGHHVAYRSIEVAMRAKSAGRFLLVTDAMPVVGSDRDEFDLEGLHITMRNDRCETDEGTLAGSALTMAQAVRNCVHRIGLPKDEALRMATVYPAGYFGVSSSVGTLSEGAWADALILDNELNVRGVIMRGEDVSSVL